MTTSFAIGTFEDRGSAFPGLVVGDRVHDITTILPTVTSTRALLDDWDRNLDRLQAFVDTAASEAAARDISDVTVRPPVQPIGQVFGAGANYRQHVLEITVAHRLGVDGASDDELRNQANRELDERAAHGDPYVWPGLPTAVSGAYDDGILPDVGTDVDWEVELGVVIGRRAHRISAADAPSHIAGYTICNDITARSLVPRSDMPMMGTDWLRSKNQPTFFPTGPYLVPARFVPDPADLAIEMRLNGQVMQSANTGDLLFGINELIAYTSSLVVLEPGDMLITGSPAGNGSYWKRFLEDGDYMEAQISGLGQQRTHVRAATGVLPPWQESRQYTESPV
ncbi:fumarylacetoacetate hydrolase family protein [Gordonia sp. CPCC 205515]|uniref:fumarylacetoacetate hydrolase family protein n=1 Tax=Gordonia sp. CPCC 205515 TaxID=3140791 RepID=UPI003AF36077